MDPVTAVAATVGATAAVAAAPAALAAVGFGAGGVMLGSIAAAVQSTMGGLVAKGSLFAIFQSWGAAGIPLAAKAAVATVGGATVAAVAAPLGAAVEAAVNCTGA